jgi:hypothetical protein
MFALAGLLAVAPVAAQEQPPVEDDPSQPAPEEPTEEPTGEEPPEEPAGEEPPAGDETPEEAPAEAPATADEESAAAAAATQPAESTAATSEETETVEDQAAAEDAAQAPEEQSEWDRWFGDSFMDTRVTFVFADDNVLAGPKDRSPQAGLSRVDDEMFFENLESEKRGQETETQLVLYKRMPSYFHRLDAEAALVIELENWVNEATWENETRIGDDGSYLKLNLYTVRDDFDGDNVNLTLFPLDSQRFLLGYTYDITWGGERIFPNNTGQVPGARLKYDFNVGQTHEGYAFFGAKTARLLNPEINEQQTYYGLLGGFGIGLTDWLNWELGGGYFQRGAFPPQGAGTSIGGKTAEAFGGSTRATLHQGMPVGHSVDFRLYKNSPDGATLITEQQQYDDGVAWTTAVEFTCVAQTLLDFDDADTSVIQPAMAAAANGRLRWGNARFHADFIYRDLSYVVFNIPGIFPYRALPDDVNVTPEWFVAGGIDYFFETPHLTPGVIFGYKQPATYESGGVTTVIRDAFDRETLPLGENHYDILAAKATLKWDVAPFFVVLGELRYTLDQNRTKYVKADDETGRQRVFEDTSVTNRLGFSVLAQAKW